jgi:molybdopterin biosynthesis enzyme MoaB
MTDLITRARKEWCEPAGQHPVFGNAFNQCPPEVVAALLDVYLLVCPPDQQCVECNGGRGNHKDDCTAGAVEAAITRALEGK